MKSLASLMLFFLGAIGPQSSRGALPSVQWREDIWCQMNMFDPRPRRVEGQRGILANEGGGLWPDFAQPVIELVQRQRPNNRYVIRADVPSGTFVLGGIPAGEYDFRAGEKRGGWGCLSGVLQISGGTSTNAFRLEIPLGQ